MRLIEVNVWSNGNNTARVDGFVTLLYKYNKVKFVEMWFSTITLIE